MRKADIAFHSGVLDMAFGANRQREDEEAVLGWLDGPLKAEYPHWVAVLKRMMARPILPWPRDVPEHVLFKMGDAANTDALKVGGMRAALKVLYDYQTLPKTRMIWRLAWSGKNTSGHCDFDGRNQALVNIDSLLSQGFDAVTISPHEVPAD